MAPSTGWKEVVQDGEQARFEEGTARLAALQARRSEKFGTGRALHRKAIAGLRGTVEIVGGLPAYVNAGVFAAPRTYEARFRLSNGAWDVNSDKRPDVRGFAIKLLGVNGPGALGSPTDAQDFLLIDRTSLGFDRPEEFFDLVDAAARSPLAVVLLFIRKHGFFDGLKRLKALQASQKSPFAGFHCTVFNSAAAIAVGDYAARVRFVPDGKPGPRAADLRSEVFGYLSSTAITGALQLQFYESDVATPIESSRTDWAETAPWVTVGRVTIPVQGPDDALAAEVEAARFDPWCALAVHRPLGAMMRARKFAYFASQKGRGAA